MSERNDGGLAERGGGGVASPGGPNTSSGGDNRSGRSGDKSSGGGGTKSDKSAGTSKKTNVKSAAGPQLNPGVRTAVVPGFGSTNRKNQSLGDIQSEISKANDAAARSGSNNAGGSKRVGDFAAGGPRVLRTGTPKPTQKPAVDVDEGTDSLEEPIDWGDPEDDIPVDNPPDYGGPSRGWGGGGDEYGVPDPRENDPPGLPGGAGAEQASLMSNPSQEARIADANTRALEIRAESGDSDPQARNEAIAALRGGGAANRNRPGGFRPGGYPAPKVNNGWNSQPRPNPNSGGRPGIDGGTPGNPNPGRPGFPRSPRPRPQFSAQGVAVGEPNPGAPEPNPEPRPMAPTVSAPRPRSFAGQGYQGGLRPQTGIGPVRSAGLNSFAGGGDIGSATRRIFGVDRADTSAPDPWPGETWA